MRRRVVLTGLGTINPIGLNSEEFWQSLMISKSGTAKITRFDTSDFTTKIAAEIKGYNPQNHFNTKEMRKLDPYSQYAVISAREAINQAKLDFSKEDKNRIGVIVGSGIGGMSSFEAEMIKLVDKGPKRISPFFIPQMISNIAAGHISIEYGIKGTNYAIVSACASSAHAIGVGCMAIQRGDAEVMVCGGSEAAITPMGIGGFNAMKAISTNNENPEKASCPFDLNRDGFVMGEGAGIVVVEEMEHAIARNANILVELVGIGFTADAFHLTQPAPEGEGAVRAMTLCLQDGNFTTNDIDYINAHGTSTPYNDKNETAAIKTVFGDRAYDLSISSSKSMTGHLLGAAGAVELIASALTVMNDKVPPTINYETPDPECDLNYTPNKAVDREVRAALSNAFGFGGHNVCLGIKKYNAS